METIVAPTSRGKYSILIAEGILSRAGDYIAQMLPGAKILIVTDANVAPFYLAPCLDSLTAAGLETSAVVLPPGETSKNLTVLEQLFNEFYKAGLTRADGVIALGGGVIGDITGFATAAYLRGINLFQAPTTLLAQVDSAIGGKTGIDMAFGKNMVGAFYPPKAVFVDPAALATLPPPCLAQGMAEVIKYGCILAKDLFIALENRAFKWDAVIHRCASLKAELAAEDEFDRGRRMLLNFGHTIGHALEKALNYQGISHGEAVSIGMIAALRIGEARGITPARIKERLLPLLDYWRLPTRLPVPAATIFDALRADKKRRGETIDFVFLKEIGLGIIQPVTLREITKTLKEA